MQKEDPNFEPQTAKALSFSNELVFTTGLNVGSLPHHINQYISPLL